MKQDFQKNNKQRPERHFTVAEEITLLEFLRKSLTDKSRNNIKSHLAFGEVTVDGKVSKKHDLLLRPGQNVSIIPSLVRGLKPKHLPDIVYEDGELIAINKPAGLLSVATERETEKTAYHKVTDYVRLSSPKARIFIVHRLDRDTSGILLFAKNERIKLALQDNWDELVSARAYVAVVEGQPAEKSGRLHAWIKQTATLFMYVSRKPGDGQEAILTYRVLRESPDYALLDVNLETGRKNQIRVQLSDLGHPVAGDKKYGAKTDPLKRLALHAYKLELRHPFTGETLRFETKIPGKFTALFPEV